MHTDVLLSIFGAHEWTHGSMSYVFVHGQCRNQPQKPAVFRCSGKLWEIFRCMPLNKPWISSGKLQQPDRTINGVCQWILISFTRSVPFNLKFHWIPHEMCVGCAFWCVQSATKLFRSTRQHLWQMRSLNRLRLLSASRKKLPWDYGIESW